MRVSQFVGCQGFPCADVKHECYAVPDADLNPDKISVMMVSEADPENPADY